MSYKELIVICSIHHHFISFLLHTMGFIGITYTVVKLNYSTPLITKKPFNRHSPEPSPSTLHLPQPVSQRPTLIVFQVVYFQGFTPKLCTMERNVFLSIWARCQKQCLSKYLKSATSNHKGNLWFNFKSLAMPIGACCSMGHVAFPIRSQDF